MTKPRREAHAPYDELVPAYCFGDVTDEQRARFEEHLLACDRCFAEVERLMVAVTALRATAHASPGTLTRSEVVGLLGISGDLTSRLAGHGMFVTAAACAYGGLYAVSLLTELSYFITRHLSLAVWAIPLVFGWMSMSALVGLVMGLRAVRRGSDRGLALSAAFLAAGAALMLLVASAVLPHEATIMATLQPRTVAGANLKNTLMFGLPLGCIFLLIPFHCVVAVQRELSEGRHENVLHILTGDRHAVPPRGMPYLSPRLLCGVMLAAAVYVVPATQYLLDHLVVGAHSELFTNLVYLRIALGMAFAAGCVVWYSRMLDEAKREALAMQRPPGQR